MKAFILGALFSILVGSALNDAHAQDAQPAQAPQTPTPVEGALGHPQRTVEVGAPLDDAMIGQRLQHILEATKRFTNPQVRVEHGVVFLSGTAKDVEYQTWAKELAIKTHDVVAVVNDIKTEESPLWDLTPALEELRSLWRKLIGALPLFVIGLAVLTMSFMVGRVVARGLGKATKRRVESDILRGIVEKGALVLVTLIGLYLFLRIAGLTQFAVTVIGGTGIAGLIAGFAFRDIAENFLSGLLISVQRPFRIGDTIEVAQQTGVVQKVTTRGTVLIDFEGNYIQLSNTTIYKSTIRNFTANPKLRIDFTLDVGYDQDLEDVQNRLLELLRGHPTVLKDPEPMVLVEKLGTSVTLRAYLWIDGQKHSKGKVQSAVMRQAVQVLRSKDSSESAHATRAEGDLGAEAKELHEQAHRSRQPEESPTVLDGGNSRRADH